MSNFSQAVLAWYKKNGRKSLPWQNPPTPYRVWVSEIMLQQTQVATVLPYFERFMQSFPDVQTLAAANIDQVLNHWSGLGYYARGRNLHKSAQRIVATYAGNFPQQRHLLEEMPGIGRSTAAAILSLSMGHSEAILDGNVKRVLARFHGVDGWPGKSSVAKQLWIHAEDHLPKKQAGPYNQAMMDLGAMVCLARKPQCTSCPLNADCVAHKSGDPLRYPGKKAKNKLPIQKAHLLLLEDQRGRLLMEKRPAQGRWGGLWSFPEFPDLDATKTWVTQQYRLNRLEVKELTPFRHTFSHFHFDITPVYLQAQLTASSAMEANAWVWYNNDLQMPGGMPQPVSKLLKQYYNPKQGQNE